MIHFRIEETSVICLYIFPVDLDHSDLLPTATKVWPRLCFYSCLWFCPQGEGLPQCMLGYHPQKHTPGKHTHPWEAHTPPGSTPPNPPRKHPPGKHTPQKCTPPPGKHTPPPEAHPPREADSGKRSMSGRYASYWNAFLLRVDFTFHDNYFNGNVSFPRPALQCRPWQNRLFCYFAKAR